MWVIIIVFTQALEWKLSGAIFKYVIIEMFMLPSRYYYKVVTVSNESMQIYLAGNEKVSWCWEKFEKVACKFKLSLENLHI
jgi:hypothetical protein